MADREILIAGAGPVGLVAALLLARSGVPVRVLERAAELPADMRASTFHPATLDMLAPLGLVDGLLAQGTEVPRWQYLQHGSGERVMFDLGLLASETHYPFRLQCEQFRLTRLALAQLQQLPHARVDFGAEVVGVEPATDGVRVAVQGPDDSAPLSLTTPWLLACDGGRSGIRKSLGLPFEGLQFPKTSITLVLDHPFHRDHPELLGVNYVWTDDGHYSLMRLRDLWRFSYSPRQDQSVEEALSEPVAQACVQRVFPRVRPYTLLQRNYYTLQQRCLDRFVHGRVLFAGDAAHLNSPAGGMGMNSGIHDARCLVEHLLPVLAGECGEEHLQRYDRRRRTIAVDEVQRLSAKNYARHRETDGERRAAIWRDLRETAADPQRQREFLLDSSMLRSLQRERDID